MLKRSAPSRLLEPLLSKFLTSPVIQLKLRVEIAPLVARHATCSAGNCEGFQMETAHAQFGKRLIHQIRIDYLFDLSCETNFNLASARRTCRAHSEKYYAVRMRSLYSFILSAQPSLASFDLPSSVAVDSDVFAGSVAGSRCRWFYHERRYVQLCRQAGLCDGRQSAIRHDG